MKPLDSWKATAAASIWQQVELGFYLKFGSKLNQAFKIIYLLHKCIVVLRAKTIQAQTKETIKSCNLKYTEQGKILDIAKKCITKYFLYMKEIVLNYCTSLPK